jgi:hypothetical protein
MEKRKCSCCGYKTIDKEGLYEICEVCYWEDDPIQKDKPDSDNGANSVSLNQAKENFKKYGASEECYIENVRKPRERE